MEKKTSSTIKHFNRLVGSQYNKHKGTHFYCYSCLHGFQAKRGENTRKDFKLLTEHLVHCKTLKPQRVVYPEDEILKFTNVHKQLKSPFVAYCDFESILKKIVLKQYSRVESSPTNLLVRKRKKKPSSKYTNLFHSLIKLYQ